MFHKPQASDAKPSDGADAASPFDQMLDAAAPATAATPSPAADSKAQNPKTRDKADAGKSAPKDVKTDGTASQVPQATASQVIVAAGGQILNQPAPANDDNTGAAGSDGGTDSASNNSASGSANSAPTGGQQSAPSPQQITPDVSQNPAAAQIPAPSQGSAKSTPAANSSGGDAMAVIPVLPQSAASAQSSPATPTVTPAASGSQDAAAATAPTSDTPSDITADAIADTSTVVASAADLSQTVKAVKAKQDRKDVTSGEVQREDATAQPAAAPQTDTPAPAAKKDSKPTKPQDQGSSTPANGQPAPSDSVAAIVMAPVQTQVPVGNAGPNSTDPVTAAGAAQTPKGSAKSNQADSSTRASATNPVAKDSLSGDGPNADGAQTPPPSTGAPAQNGFMAQAGDASQNRGNKSAAPAGDKSAKQVTTAAPVQGLQPQAAQSQPVQSQPAQSPPAQSQAAVLASAQPQLGPAGAPPPVTQNVEVSQPDSGSTANTIGALAVTIAAKSQSGNKQFDIRLDPPELGRVEVRLSIDATGKAEASLSADQPRTLDMLKTDAPVLARALRDAGLNVSQNGLNFSLRGQDRQNGGNNFTPRGGRATQLSLVATSAIGSVPGGAHYQAPADGRLDIRV